MASQHPQHPELYTRQRVLAVLEDGQLTGITPVPPTAYILTAENAAAMLPNLVAQLAPQFRLVPTGRA